MRKLELAYKEVGYFSDLILDYLEEKETLTPFYNYSVSIKEFATIIADKYNDSVNREILVSALQQQNKSFTSAYNLVKENIEALSDEKTYTITTGHQLCICGGPLYFIYKIVSIINLCKSLKSQYPGNNFVPVFWLASEDHGDGEITKVNLFNKTFEWQHIQKGASGKRTTAPYNQLNTELRDLLGDDQNALEILDLFEQSYSGADNLAQATRSYLYRLFGEYGLIVIDGDDRTLKQEFAPLMQDELEKSSTLRNVTETVNRLGQNYKVQANVRAINLFYLGDGFRERIVKEGEGFSVLNTKIKFSKEEILIELKNAPEKFSPNVLMRPLYQEKILPNLAYIGGPGEVAYWVQLKSNFEYHHVNFPMVVLRDSVQWIDSGSVERLKKLKIDVSAIFKPIEQLERDYLATQSGSFSIEEYRNKLTDIFTDLSVVISQIDQSLSASIEGERKKQQKGLDNIEGKVNKAIKRKHEVELNQLRKLKDKLFPNEGLQERRENIIPYYAKYGKEFILVLLENLDVLNKKLTVLLEESN
ncbi:MAG: bacillithiol biosynthesis cysteine-adding enzyme BshC [Flavobacteriales bacterium]|nr:bacillithiol biosynthesis cysteine-adding enzyme BshC [Flavobacteriales bacterium]